MKSKVLTRLNAIIAAILSFLGITSCNNMPVLYGTPAMYGVPIVNLQASGKVTDKQDNPLQNINIQIKKEVDGEKYDIIYGSDIYTDEQGKWKLAYNLDLPVDLLEKGKDTIWVYAIDTTATYLPDSTKIEIVLDRTNAEGWVEGTCTIEQDFQLTENEEK